MRLLARRLFTVCSALLLACLLHPSFGCRAQSEGMTEQQAIELGLELRSILRQGMTEQQALDALEITGPVTGVVGLGGNSRTVESPKLPGWWIVLVFDADRHLIEWEWHTSAPAPSAEPAAASRPDSPG